MEAGGYLPSLNERSIYLSGCGLSYSPIEFF